VIAAVYSLWVGLGALSRGSDWNETYDVSTTRVIGGYFLAAALAGPIAGMLAVRTRSPGARVLVGLLIGPLVYGILAQVATDLSWHAPPVVIAGLAVGGIVGWQLRHD